MDGEVGNELEPRLDPELRRREAVRQNRDDAILRLSDRRPLRSGVSGLHLAVDPIVAGELDDHRNRLGGLGCRKLFDVLPRQARPQQRFMSAAASAFPASRAHQSLRAEAEGERRHVDVGLVDHRNDREGRRVEVRVVGRVGVGNSQDRTDVVAAI